MGFYFNEIWIWISDSENAERIKARIDGNGNEIFFDGWEVSGRPINTVIREGNSLLIERIINLLEKNKRYIPGDHVAEDTWRQIDNGHYDVRYHVNVQGEGNSINGLTITKIEIVAAS